MATLTAGNSATFTLGTFQTLNIKSGGKGTLSFTSSSEIAQPSFTANVANGNFGPYNVSMSVVMTMTDGSADYTLVGNSDVTATTDSITGVSSLVVGGQVVALSEVSPYVNLTATGTAFTGACEYAGYICTIAAGNITIYDNTSAAGTVIVPTTALTVGAFPIFGAGTNGKMALTTGCYVVLSGAATVNVLVG